MKIFFGVALAACALLFTAPLASAVESLVVTTITDEDNGTSDPAVGSGTSLREAINYANTSGAGRAAITFSETAFAAPRKTIVLNGTPLPTIVRGTFGTPLSITAPAAGVEISGNHASRIFYIDNGAVTMTGLTLRNGKATGDFGGALYNKLGFVVMDSCTFTANTAGAGGAIASHGFFLGGYPPNTMLRNCTIFGNYATSDGGGVYASGGVTQIDSCTITGNEADTDSKGGGVGSNRFGDAYSLVRNSIIARNDPDDVANDDFVSQGYNLIGVGDTGGRFTKTGDQVIGTGDPGLGALAENGGDTKTCALTANSLARDTGNTDLPVDQRGVSRPQGLVDDKGAFEFNTGTYSESLVVTTTTDEDNGTSDPSFGTGTSLREAINFASVYGGNNTITFSASAFAAPRKTIILSGTQLPPLTGKLAITAPAAGVQISGNNVSRVLQVNPGANVTLSGLTISSGHPPSGSAGGGILNGGKLLLSACTLSGNIADAGGAIYSDTDLSTALSVINCTISGNAATQTGGGLHNGDGLVKIESSTIVGNSAPAGAGSGVFSFGNNTTRTEVRNSIISANTNTDVDFAGGATNSFQSNGYNLIGDGNAVGDFNQTGDVTGNSDPGLEPLADNGGPTRTRALLPTSPARNTGNSSSQVDQRGVVRFQEGRDDKGAFELSLSESLVVTTTADEDDGTSDPAFGTGTSLREAINRANSMNTHSAITFDPAPFNAPRKTITLTQPLPPIVVSAFSSITAPPAGVEIKGNKTFPLFTNGAPLTITGVTFRDGHHNGRGGAIQSVNNLTLDSCTFVNNSATVGGAVTTANYPLTVRNCTFFGNIADLGGAIYVFDGAQVLIESSTITGNTAPAGQGSGVGSRGFASSLTRVHNSIIAGNTNGDVDFVGGTTNSFQSDGHNLIGDGNATADFGQTGDVLIGNGNPRLFPLADNGGPAQTMELEATSPAIDKGNSSVALDQRGLPRPIDFAAIPNATGGNGADIGAYELATQPAGIFLVRSFLPHNPTPRSVLLPLTGGGVEGRTGGAGATYQLVFSFLQPLSSVGGVRVSAGSGAVVTASSGIDPDAHNFTAILTGVANAQTITVTLDYVQDTAGGFSSTVSADVGVLVGDVNGDRMVNSGDATITRTASGQPATSTNFRADVNRDGAINSGDATIVRGRSGQSLL